jgi:protein involved in polysaccharide export with SLBB domain
MPMSQPASLVNINNTGSKRSGGDCSRMLRVACFVAGWVMVFSVTAGAPIYCQILSGSASGQSVAQSPIGEVDRTSGEVSDDGADLSEIGIASASPGNFASQTALSADQIINILQESPDLVVELKSELADRMQQQGMQIEQNDISDQMLFSQISTNASLRASVTSVMRARGYVSDGDLQSMGSRSSTDSAALNSFSSGRPSGSLTGAAEAGLDANSPMKDGSLPQTSGNGSLENTNSSTLSDRNRNGSKINLRGQEKANSSTDLPTVIRQTAPYNLQSMRDLYTQIPSEATRLTRFGSDVFVNHSAFASTRGTSSQDTALDVPLGPDYIVGFGDTLKISLWGGLTESFTRTIGGDGRIFLPEAGSIEIAGLSLGKAQGLIEGTLKQQYRNAQVAVTIARLRSVRVYVVGDVQRPGGYDISSLATPISALYAANGPTSVGSLRTLLHYRGKQLIEKVDLYDFLLHGIRSGSAAFENGDTLFVPPAGPQVAVFGEIKRPAIYELKAGETTLATVIDDAGGLTAAASLSHIKIERIDTDHLRETVTLRDGDALATFQINDGDRICIEPILPYSRRAIYLAGHVVRPGRLPYTDGMHLTDVLRSYQDMLPEPSAHGEIVRLVPPDLHAETIDFNIPDVLAGNVNFDLHPFDTIRILGRYEVDAPTVTIRGEVERPGQYPMSKDMTAAQLVRMAGGFKRDALVESADLTSYDVKDGDRVAENLVSVRLGAAVAGTDPHADMPLKPGDILSIHQITNWNNIGESATIKGQVRFPGSYGFQDGEHLSSVLRRAGGLLSTAYPAGAVLTRVEVRELEQKSRDELIHQIETNAAAARLSPGLAGGNAAGELQLIKAQQDQVISDLKNHPPTGRLVIHIGADINKWANTPADIELRRGDVVTIPKRPGFVLITGQVYNATALTFAPNKTAAWYLSRAGGTNSTANRKEIFVIRANGSVIGRRSIGWFNADVLSTRLNPGDVIVVPQKVLGASLFWKNLLATGQLAASIAITAGVAAAAL